ncbi:MAG TPA: dual specificity protein phosphatase [Candidatus Bathyarchaeia archaeon]|nr:dual specificity protein phosphatase [Candidatus Bathyarchaeia archaeon]
MNEIIPGLWLGNRDDASALSDVHSDWAIIAISDYPENEIPNEPFGAYIYSIFTNRKFDDEGEIVWYDSCDLRVDQWMLDWIATLAQAYMDIGFQVLIHCVAGIHRSPLVVANMLFKQGYFDSLDAAYNHIKSLRPEIERREYWLKSTNPPPEWWQ